MTIYARSRRPELRGQQRVRPGSEAARLSDLAPDVALHLVPAMLAFGAEMGDGFSALMTSIMAGADYLNDEAGPSFRVNRFGSLITLLRAAENGVPMALFALTVGLADGDNLYSSSNPVVRQPSKNLSERRIVSVGIQEKIRTMLNGNLDWFEERVILAAFRANSNLHLRLASLGILREIRNNQSIPMAALASGLEARRTLQGTSNFPRVDFRVWIDAALDRGFWPWSPDQFVIEQTFLIIELSIYDAMYGIFGPIDYGRAARLASIFLDSPTILNWLERHSNPPFDIAVRNLGQALLTGRTELGYRPPALMRSTGLGNRLISYARSRTFR